MAQMRRGKITFEGIISALLGGFGSTVGMNQLDARVSVFQKNKVMSPIANGVAALSVIYFGGERAKPFGYGMLGASGADAGNEIVNGLSRIEIENEGMDGALEDLEQEVEDLQDENQALKTEIELEEEIED